MSESKTNAPDPAGSRPGGRSRRLLVLLAVLVLLLGYSGYRQGYVPGTGPHRLRQARAALERHDLAEAAQVLAQCVADSPEDGDLRLLLARTLRRGGLLQQADREYALAVQYGADPEVLALEGMLRRAQVGEAGLLEPTLAKRLEEAHPDSLLIMEALVLGHLQRMDMASALRLTTLWVDNFPDTWQPFFLRGTTYQQADSGPAAAADFAKALALNPDLIQVRLGRAELLLEMKRHEEALSEFNLCLEKFPDLDRARLGVAACRFGLGRLEEAEAALAPLVKKPAPDPWAAFLQGRLVLARQGPDAALPWLNQAHAKIPNDPEILFVLAEALRDRDPKRAESFEKESIGIREKRLRLAKMRQEVFRGRPPANEEDLRKHLRTRIDMGRLAAELGFPTEAANWYRTVLQVDPENAAARQAMADLTREIVPK